MMRKRDNPRSGSCRRYLAFILALIPAACARQPVRPPVAAPREATVYVIGRGWHTDIGLSVHDIAGPLTVLERRFPGVRTLVFGFGERGYVVDGRRDVLHMLRALLPARGAVLVTALRAPPVSAFGAAHVVALPTSRAGADGVAAFVWRSLQRDRHGAPVPLGAGPYPGSAFYASAVTYSAFNTCNTWTAQALRRGGFAVQAAGVLFAGQVMEQARYRQGGTVPSGQTAVVP